METWDKRAAWFQSLATQFLSRQALLEVAEFFHRHPSFFSHVPSKVMRELGKTYGRLEHCRRAAGVDQTMREQSWRRTNLAIIGDPIP
jgi:hypothetical protein